MLSQNSGRFQTGQNVSIILWEKLFFTFAAPQNFIHKQLSFHRLQWWSLTSLWANFNIGKWYICNFIFVNEHYEIYSKHRTILLVRIYIWGQYVRGWEWRTSKGNNKITAIETTTIFKHLPWARHLHYHYN